MTAMPDGDHIADKPQKIYFDEVDGPAMRAYDHDRDCMVVAIVVSEGGQPKVLAMTEEAAQDLGRWLTGGG